MLQTSTRVRLIDTLESDEGVGGVEAKIASRRSAPLDVGELLGGSTGGAIS